VFTECEELFIADWCVLSVCLSVSLHLSVRWYLSEGPVSSKYGGINEAMNDVLTCYKFHLLCWADTFKCKTKTKTKPKQNHLYLTFRHQKKERLTRNMLFPKWTLCNMQSVAVWTASYVTLFTALIPVPYVDEECSNVNCVSGEFRTATLRTHNYSNSNTICMYMYICVCHFGKM
jgi:hypothetical protein